MSWPQQSSTPWWSRHPAASFVRGMWCWPGSQPRARWLLTITALCLASVSSFLGPLEQLEFAGGRHLVAGVPRPAFLCADWNEPSVLKRKLFVSLLPAAFWPYLKTISFFVMIRGPPVCLEQLQQKSYPYCAIYIWLFWRKKKSNSYCILLSKIVSHVSRNYRMLGIACMCR